MGLIIGVALIAVAISLVFIGRPDKSGQRPRFLQFEASLVLYPPVIMALGVLGTVEVIATLLGLTK